MKKYWKEQIELVFVILLIIGLVIITQRFTERWHSVDSMYNSKNLLIQFNDLLRPNNLYLPNNFTDIGIDYVKGNVDSYYISGMNGIRNYFIFAVIDALLLGFMLGSRLTNDK